MRNERKRQLGLSLIEIALAIVILGFAALLLWRTVDLGQRDQRTVKTSSLINRANAALKVYAFIHARLPCAASDTGGLEDCGAADEGHLPYRTLGLPDLKAASVIYHPDMSLTTVGAAFSPLMASTHSGDLTSEAAPLRAVAPASYDQMLDLCAILQDSGTLSSAGYVLSIPEADAGVPLVNGAKSHAELSSSLGCISLLSIAGKSHFNAALAAAANHRAVQDLLVQYKLSVDLAITDLAGSTTWLTSSAYTAVKTVTNENFGLSIAFASFFTNWTTFTGAVALQSTALADVFGMTSNVINYAVEVDLMKKNLAELNNIGADMLTFQTDVTRHAIINASSAYGFEAQ